MNCNDSQSYMMKFFDRDLNDIEEAKLKQHLKNCNKCSEEFLSLKEIFTEIEEVSEIEPPEDFELQVMSRIKNETTMYKKSTNENVYVYNIVLIALSITFVTILGGVLWDALNHPFEMFKEAWIATDFLKQLLSAAASMFKGIAIAVVGVAASLYKTYYYAYIILGILLLLIQKVFVTMVKEGDGGAQ